MERSEKAEESTNGIEEGEERRGRYHLINPPSLLIDEKGEGDEGGRSDVDRVTYGHREEPMICYRSQVGLKTTSCLEYGRMVDQSRTLTPPPLTSPLCVRLWTLPLSGSVCVEKRPESEREREERGREGKYDEWSTR